jgi:hypothetical protein
MFRRLTGKGHTPTVGISAGVLPSDGNPIEPVGVANV